MAIGDASWNILSGQYCWGDLVEIYPWWPLLLRRSGFKRYQGYPEKVVHENSSQSKRNDIT